MKKKPFEMLTEFINIGMNERKDKLFKKEAISWRISKII